MGLIPAVAGLNAGLNNSLSYRLCYSWLSCISRSLCRAGLHPTRPDDRQRKARFHGTDKFLSEGRWQQGGSRNVILTYTSPIHSFTNEIMQRKHKTIRNEKEQNYDQGDPANMIWPFFQNPYSPLMVAVGSIPTYHYFPRLPPLLSLTIGC